MVEASGRLDASWAEHFSTTFREFIRQGYHQIVIDASDMSYISSAGIRALVQVSKSITGVNGSFMIVRANNFVSKTLDSTGFGGWLRNAFPGDMPESDTSDALSEEHVFASGVLDKSASLTLSLPAKWRPWKAVRQNSIANIRFREQDFALGIGAPEQPDEKIAMRLGDFLAVGGHVVYQPPAEGENPDFLMAEKAYVPELQCIQALHCSGGMSHFIRFAPQGNKTSVGMGELAEQVLQTTSSRMAAFVAVAEIEGIVGASLIRSPGFITEARDIAFPELKSWISFCGERVHSRQQALLFGLASRQRNGGSASYLPASGLYADLHMHVHAAVFPYQPLGSGAIQLNDTLHGLFTGAPPIALYHLVEDSRPGTGLGESDFIRGACWCAPIKNDQEDLLWE